MAVNTLQRVITINPNTIEFRDMRLREQTQRLIAEVTVIPLVQTIVRHALLRSFSNHMRGRLLRQHIARVECPVN
ncbi:MAG: hypothetical protein BWZ07_02012 [Alphaproteobacteria bacterium ADurb.BinA280]|nr:MAG: hypothetical protein BWZ07_02012 [Alphaproteobacteria bacterium ADurb.BinA280]